MSSTTNEAGKAGPTTRLATWIANLTLNDIPEDIITRSKYLILDGIACGLVGAHLPWSERAAETIFELEPSGDATIFGWDRSTPILSAALLNSSFIQGFELDDWHSDAPLHSNSIILPAVLAALQHIERTDKRKISGREFLLAVIAGYETGPRVGLGLYGADILSSGWHSGAVFGPSASAASVGKLLGLDSDKIEDAFGTACTQAGGLMSAQFGSDVKRMQHGFAARAGLLAAFLARSGYTGIRNVFEVEYGGFLKQFSAGNGKTPQYRPEEVAKDLGSVWQTDHIRVKPYASMAATHSTVDCVRKLQEKHTTRMGNLDDIKAIRIELGEVAYHHGGFKVSQPLSATGAQMSNAFVAATQLVHSQVLAAQFQHDLLEDKRTWSIVERVTCEQFADPSVSLGCQKVTITFMDNTSISEQVEAARGVDPALSNQEIREKYKLLTKGIMDDQRAAEIEDLILKLDHETDLSALLRLLGPATNNPIA